ncbi:hypothetical protein ACWEFJ_04880 [Actinosynnema sp. NPDC004786]
MLRSLITRTATRCPAPTGRKGGHCGKPLRRGRLSDGVTCGGEMCQLWHLARHL